MDIHSDYPMIKIGVQPSQIAAAIGGNSSHGPKAGVFVLFIPTLHGGLAADRRPPPVNFVPFIKGLYITTVTKHLRRMIQGLSGIWFVSENI